ncbi:MAG: V-type ATP synthase subunit I [Marinilabiliaceae bacterium]|nr:V-type ATP synthase subunit I [Marinilabiliaceae bacterium]
MIIPMHKYSFLIYHAEYSKFLDELKRMGVLHIIESDNEPTLSIQDDYRLANDVTKTIKFLKTEKSEEAKSSADIPTDGAAMMAAVKDIQSNLEQLNQQHNALDKELKQLQPWGAFSHDSIERLQADAGLTAKFYYCASRKFDASWEQDYSVGIITEERGYIYFVLFLEEGEIAPELDAEEIRLPKESLSEVQALLNNVSTEKGQLQNRLKVLANSGVEILEHYLLEVQDKIASESAQLHTSDQVEGAVKMLEGWVPESRIEELEGELEKAGVFYQKASCKHDEKPPVLLKNNPFNKLFEMISNLYSLPNYSELDLTPFLAPFYLLFFGFCFSDAGYGLLFVAVASYFKMKKPESPAILSLIQLLGASTMFFGILGGTFFGIELYNTNLPVYRDLAESMKASGITVQDIMFKASLGLGVIQILFGMFLRAVKTTKQLGFKFAISTLGWAFLIIFSGVNYYLSSKGIVEFGNIPYYVVASLCGVAIFFMNTPGKSLLLNFGTGLWDTYNTVVGGVGDLLSYVRLFALGLASAILGLVFNDLALKLVNPEAGFIMQGVGIILMLVVLVIGHAINIFMSGLGSMVHPLRLTFVEFYKNAGFEGGGKAYNPFRKQTN